MKDEDPPGVRRDALLLLYRRLGRNEAARDRRSSEITDHALTLTLSQKRAVTSAPFLAQDALRDARRIYSRRQDPLLRATRFDTHPEENLPPPFIEAPTMRPDRIAEARELVARITEAVADLPHGPGCLEGIALGESVEESASRLGLSPRQVRYARQLVREMAMLVSGRLS